MPPPRNYKSRAYPQSFCRQGAANEKTVEIFTQPNGDCIGVDPSSIGSAVPGGDSFYGIFRILLLFRNVTGLLIPSYN